MTFFPPPSAVDPGELTLAPLPSTVYVNQVVPLSAYGGAGSYYFTIGQASFVAESWTPSSAGTYTVVVTDAAGETREQTTTVVGPGGAAGSGANTEVITINDSVGDPIPEVDVWVTTGTDAQTGIVAGTLQTDTNGQVTFFLDSGTYYIWAQKIGTNFTNPTEITV